MPLQGLHERAYDPDTAAAFTLNLEDRLRPDLLILDVSLPGLKGVDVFDLIRGTARWGEVPVALARRVSDLLALATAAA